MAVIIQQQRIGVSMRNSRKKFGCCFLLILLLPLAGCSKTIVSDVTRFHNLSRPDAETIEVFSIDPALQKSLEFGQYAELVGRYLGKAGYSPPPADHPSRFIARIGYGVRLTDGYDDYGSRSSVGIGVGGGSRHTSVGVGMSFPIGQSEPRQDYIHILTMDIIRRADGIKLYEGQVTSRSKDSLTVIMPYLVDAMFRDFPGESGTSNKVKTKVSP